MGLTIALAVVSAVAAYGAYRIGTKPNPDQIYYLFGLIVVAVGSGCAAIALLF